MPVSKILKIGYIRALILSLATLVAATGCVKQTLDECPPEPPPVTPEVSQLLYLRVSDGVTRADISDSEELDDIMVYLFDRDENLVDTIPYTMGMIGSGVPIDLTDKDMTGGYATVWANLGNSVEMTPVTLGADIDDLEVTMLANDSRADFYLCPGDMFFGYKGIAFIPVDETTQADTVWIARKNSRLNVTVRGLSRAENPDGFYFRIESLYSAYNFEGAPQLEARNIWEQGVFNDTSEFVSPEPYIMIHNAVDHVYSETSKVVIDLYRMGLTRADTLIATGDRSTDGDYIRLEQGKTTNVLMVLDQATGEVEVRMEITPWDEIHQWTFW